MAKNPDLKQPFAQWEVVDVTFPSAANTDLLVAHSLQPPSPEHVYYWPIRNAQAARVYHDVSGSRKPWQASYIWLRSDVASAKMTLLLFVQHGTPTLAF